MRRISYWVLSTVSAFVLLFGFDASQRGATGASHRGHHLRRHLRVRPSNGGSAGGTGNGSGATTGTGSNGYEPGSAAPSPSSATRTVTGSVAQTQWGPVQVQLTVGNGAITKVTRAAVPERQRPRRRDRQLLAADLIKETIQSQSAKIDMVSGATYTSTGYIQSLQSALDQANL